nr:reverse transcriptase domain-containing protein [Tanacetum cinerariifolium]
DDPSLPPPNQGNYLPQVRKELKICEVKSDKSSNDEPPEIELKDLPPHLEYAFLEGGDKLPVIITKYLSAEEKTALITEDFEPAVQHQRRVNPKIYDVIKNVVLKLLDAGLIYPISDNFDADPRVPLILRRSFLKTGRALIDVFEGELTLHVGKEAITFNLDPTSRYSANYNDMMANRIDVIDVACEEYSQEVLSFFDVITSGNPTPYYDLIISTTSLTLTPFGNSDFLLEEVDAFLALEDDPTSPE